MRSLGHSSGRLRGAGSPGHATTAGVLSERAGAGPWTAARAPSSGRMLASAGPCVGSAFAVRRKRRPLGACSACHPAAFPGCMHYGAGTAPRRLARQRRAPHGNRTTPAQSAPPAMLAVLPLPTGAELALLCMPCGRGMQGLPWRPVRMRRERAGRMARRQTRPAPAPLPVRCMRSYRARGSHLPPAPDAPLPPALPAPVQNAAGGVPSGPETAVSRQIGRASFRAAGSSLASNGDLV